ncbi:MAG: hypothetical protein ACC726_00535 [Chloroflexota bacterium]
MRPDPGADMLERVLLDLGAEKRARIGWELRERGFLLVWDQVDHAAPMSEVDEAMFILERLYPEMPGVHRASIRRHIEADHAAGDWHGFQRPSASSPLR